MMNASLNYLLKVSDTSGGTDMPMIPSDMDACRRKTIKERGEKLKKKAEDKVRQTKLLRDRRRVREALDEGRRVSDVIFLD